jgi:hypothetical protein
MAAAVPGPAWRGYGPVPHRPWSTVFLVAHAVVGVLGLLAIGGAVLAVGLTLLNQPGPDYEGIDEPYGLVIGAVLAVVGARSRSRRACSCCSPPGADGLPTSGAPGS